MVTLKMPDVNTQNVCFVIGLQKSTLSEIHHSECWYSEIMDTYPHLESIYVLGERVRCLRTRMGYGQKEVSKMVNDLIGKNDKNGSQSHIANLENSTTGRLPSVQVLWALALVLQTNTDYLLGLTDDDRPASKLDDQVVVTVENPAERKVVQEVAELVASASADDKTYVASLVRRLLPKKPRIIGDE